MKTKYFNYFLLFIAVIIIYGCQEVYEPEGLDSSEKIIVIDGFLNDLDSIFIVKIYYASPFDQGKYEPINNALVSFRDEYGNSFILQSASQLGSYRLYNNQINIRENIDYYVHVETPDGNIFESVPQELPGKIQLKDIKARIGEYIDVSKNVYGEVTTKKIQGLALKASAQSTDSAKRYVRFENTAVYQTQYSAGIGTAFPYTVHCVSTVKVNDLPIVEPTYYGLFGEAVRNIEMGFLSYIAGTSGGTDSTSPVSSNGWIVIYNAYSISADSYNFYTKIEKQVNADNKMFDPQPSQIIGNIRCINDPDKIALGNFEVSTGVRKYIAYYWFTGLNSIRTKELEQYKIPDDGCEGDVEFETITF